MKLNKKNLRFIIPILLFDIAIIATLLLVNIPRIIFYNPIFIIIIIAEIVIIDFFLHTLLSQYYKYKKRIFGEIIKFKITIYVLANFIITFILIIVIFIFINNNPGLNKAYDDLYTQIEDSYKTSLMEIEKIKGYLTDFVENKISVQKFLSDPDTLYLKAGNVILKQCDLKNKDEVLLKSRNQIDFFESSDFSCFAYNSKTICFIYNVDQHIINTKNKAFSILTSYRKIYSQKKTTPIYTSLALFIIFIPILYIQIYLLVKQINYITSPLYTLVSHMKKISSNVFEEIPLPKKRFDEFAFLIIQFNKMQEQLEHRTLLLKYQERYDTFKKVSSRFAHEIKNPLTPILLSCELIEKKYPYDDKFKTYLFNKISIIKQNVETIKENIGKFYSFSDVDSNLSNKVPVIDFFNNLKNYWNSDYININLQLPADDIYVAINQENFESCFNNLIINSYEAAISAQIKKVEILIKITTENEKIVILFSDNGPGVEDSISSSIFEPYFTTKESGSGIGLSIVKSTFESANGTLVFLGNNYLNSETYRGATFQIEIPAGK